MLIPEEKLRAAIFIYSDIDANKALEYWSDQIKLSKKQFIKTQILPSHSKLTQRRTLYGMCNVYFSSTEFNVKMRGWIDLLANDYAAMVHR
ncbi:hypothetical protein HZB69_03070 [Candidatus Amesbacteria bacterium]|nr:hypothetical protein [Candidatus Amesbacteria bacterium]